VLIVGVEEEQLVLDDRAANRETVDLTQILRFQWLLVKANGDGICSGELRSGEGREVIVGVPAALAVEEIGGETGWFRSW
jgi:hypothetical protein